MLSTGLCSITFRQHTVDEVIELAATAKLDGIEWGGDVHVPPGDRELALTVRDKTIAAGLKVCSYGSYYSCNDAAGAFSDCLDSAQALGAPVIRVWAGKKGSAEASAEERVAVVGHLKRAVIAAREVDITVALEYHGGTLTDTQVSAHQLLQAVGMPELKLYWQPRTGGTFAGDIPELKAALPVLAHVHAFHWVKQENGEIDRRPFAEGIQDWQQYLEIIHQAEGDRSIIFEFVRDARPEQLLEDAKVLQSLLKH